MTKPTTRKDIIVQIFSMTPKQQAQLGVGIAIIIIIGLAIGFYEPKETIEEPIGANPPNSVTINGKEKDISYTDDNTGEDLIIKTDFERYFNIGGNITVHYSIYNSSKEDQNIKTAFSFTDGETKYVKDIWEHDGEDEIIIPAYEVSISSTTKETKTIPAKTIYRTKWKELGLEDFTDKLVTRKDLKDTEPQKETTAFIKAGETKFFKANVAFTDFENEDEFFIEAFGDKGSYGHLDPWTYEQLFNGLNDGDLNGQDSWTAHVGIDVTTAADARFEGAKGLIFSGALDTTAERTVSDTTAGTVYMAVRVDVLPTWWALVSVNEDTAANMRVLFMADQKIYWDVAASNTYIMDYVLEQWYVVAIQYDNVAQPNKYRVDIHDGDDWIGFTNWGLERSEGYTVINNVLFNPGQEAGQLHYIDTVTPTNPFPPPAPEVIDDAGSQDIMFYR